MCCEHFEDKDIVNSSLVSLAHCTSPRTGVCSQECWLSAFQVITMPSTLLGKEVGGNSSLRESDGPIGGVM